MLPNWLMGYQPEANCEIILSKGVMKTLDFFDKGQFDSVWF